VNLEDAHGRRGDVRRLSPSSPAENDPHAVSSSISRIRWSRRQDHHAHYTTLIRLELEDELVAVEERLRAWSDRRLKDAGIALFRLRGRTAGWLFGERILSFQSEGGDDLPWHKFGQGDIVSISRKRPWLERSTEGTVLDRSRRRLRVVVNDTPDDLRQGTWRLDRAANRVAHDRMREALDAFASIDEGATPLDDVLLASLHDLQASSERPPDIPKHLRVRADHPLEGRILNGSQREAVSAALSRRLTLIQGPPGTGKTHTAVEILTIMAEHGSGPILATADSNVAVDNLLQGLLERGVRAIRTGQPVKVRDELREATLDAHLAEHPLKLDVSAIQDDTREIQRGMTRLKGREKGLAHRDVNRNWKEIRALERRMIEEVLDRAQVICATCIGTGHHAVAERRFPTVLIDEATQATEPACLVPIVRGARQLILVGDHRQLPPTIISQRAMRDGLGMSLFERLVEAGVEPFLLAKQYRMHPAISEFPSARFYGGLLDDGVTAEDRPAPAGFIWPDWDRPVAFVPVEGLEGTDSESQSRFNPEEASLVLRLVEMLLEGGEVGAGEIGIITPYNGQVRMLSDLFDGAGGRGEEEPFEGLEIRSVDGYQGREKEVIIFSCVRANDEGEVGFLSDRRRLNVALTRARRGLIVLGHPSTLRRDPTWAGWLDWVEEQRLMAWHVLGM